MYCNKYIYAYYGILLLILISWSNMSVAPNIVLRLLFLVAIVAPICLGYKVLLPPVLTCFITISHYGYAYSYMPTEMYIYAILTIILTIFLSYWHEKIPISLIILLLYTLIVNLITSFQICDISYTLATMIMLFYFFDKNGNFNIKLLNQAFIITTFVLSLIFILKRREFTQAYLSSGLERSGWMDPNYFGMVLGMGIIISCIILLTKKVTSLTRLFLIMTIIIPLIVVLLLASRGTLLAIAISMLILIFFSRIKLFYKLIVICLGFGLVIYAYHMGILELLLYRIQNDTGDGSGRLSIWLNKIEAFTNSNNVFNWLFGMGQENGLKLANLKYSEKGIIGFHNDYLAFLVEYGILGLVTLLIVLINPILNTIKAKCNMHKYIVFACVAYLMLCCATLEPIALGRFPFFAFYIYTLLFSRNLQLNEHE